MGCRSRFNSGLSLIRAGEKLPEKEKPGLILGFHYVPLRVQEPGGAIERRWYYGCKADR